MTFKSFLNKRYPLKKGTVVKIYFTNLTFMPLIKHRSSTRRGREGVAHLQDTKGLKKKKDELYSFLDEFVMNIHIAYKTRLASVTTIMAVELKVKTT